METSAVAGDTRTRRNLIWAGVVLVIAGFFGHFLAARAIGGTYVAYRDHMAGFFGMTIISGAMLALLGRRFWRGGPDITVLVLGIIQAAFGLFVYINRFHLMG